MISGKTRLALAVIPFVLGSICCCSEHHEIPDVEEEEYRQSLDSAELVFAFSEKKRYSYCPVVLEQENGDRYMFFCGNPAADPKLPNEQIIIDNVYLSIEHPDGTFTKEKSVLQPTEGSWDAHHTCDPSVIQGVFRMGGQTYRYAMFYTGCTWEYWYSELGVAFSNDLDSDSWVKYPGQLVPKTWTSEGDLLWSGGKCWGTGQPAAVSLDKKGKVLLAYSVGDLAGSREMWCQMDLSDMDNIVRTTPSVMPRTGLKDLEGQLDWVTNVDLAINEEDGVIVIERPVNPLPTLYPDYICTTQEVNYMPLEDFMSGKGVWRRIGRITPEMTGFQRNHNGGLLRDNYGYIRNWRNPTVYFAVSETSPKVYLSPELMAEWTYDIYKITLSGLK